MNYARRTSAGIYEIRNTVTGDRYFGSSVNLRHRSQTHASALRNGRHGNARLQAAWDKYGKAAFRFVVLAVLEQDETLPTEARLLAKHVGSPGCYNMAEDATAPMMGRKHTPEAIEKIRRASTGRRHSDATKAKMSAWQKGTKRPDWPNGMRGKRLSTERRAHLSEIAKGRVLSDEHRRGIGDAIRGRRHSEEARQRMSEARREWWAKRRGEAA